MQWKEWLSVPDLLTWVSELSSGGVCVVAEEGEPVFENRRFSEMLVLPERVPRQPSEAQGADPILYATRAALMADACAWGHQPVGAGTVRRYRGLDLNGGERSCRSRFTVVPVGKKRATLVLLEDVTDQEHLSAQAEAAARFQSVLAQIGGLAVSGTPIQELLSAAARLTAEALRVELCKILIPRETEEHLYLVAGIGWRQDLIGRLTVEGGCQSQAGFAIRERRPVIVRDLRAETRFTPSRLLSEHGGIAGVSVPMMVKGHVYGVMGAHCKSVRDFSAREVEFLCSVANTVGTVLERWRHEETQLQLYQRLFELVRDGVMLTDTEGRLLEWNPAMERMTGWTRKEVMGKTPGLLHSGKHPPEFYERLWQTIRSGQAFADRFINRRKDGSEFLVWESVSPVKDPDGGIRYCLAILTDLTEREQMLDALRHAEQVKLVGQLAGGILHEIRNPLIGIGSLATHLAGQGNLEKSVRNRCRLIAEEANRIDGILESHLGQISSKPFDFRPCELTLPLEETLELLRTKLHTAGVVVETHLKQPAPPVEASQRHLQQVWLNIIINAIEAMPEGGRLKIDLSPARRMEEGVLIRFQDTGGGIAPENLKRIHEPFFTSGKAKGVGLGLTVTRDIIERHGGQFTIASPSGSGAVVEVWLPLRQRG